MLYGRLEAGGEPSTKVTPWGTRRASLNPRNQLYIGGQRFSVHPLQPTLIFTMTAKMQNYCMKRCDSMSLDHFVNAFAV